MKAAWYSQNGEAQDVMQVGDMPTPSPQAGEVLVRRPARASTLQTLNRGGRVP